MQRSSPWERSEQRERSRRISDSFLDPSPAELRERASGAAVACFCNRRDARVRVQRGLASRVGPVVFSELLTPDTREREIAGAMHIAVLGINYWPDRTGIAPFTTGRCEYLAARGHRVTVFTGFPYYPGWRVPSAYRGRLLSREVRNGVSIFARGFTFRTSSRAHAASCTKPRLSPRLRSGRSRACVGKNRTCCSLCRRRSAWG